MEPYVTHHARQRIHERMGVRKKVSDRVAKLALERGLRASETKGMLKKYTGAVFLSHMNGNNMRIYAEKVFVFQEDALVTVLPLPNDLKKLARICQKEKEKKNEKA